MFIIYYALCLSIPHMIRFFQSCYMNRKFLLNFLWIIKYYIFKGNVFIYLKGMKDLLLKKHKYYMIIIHTSTRLIHMITEAVYYRSGYNYIRLGNILLIGSK